MLVYYVCDFFLMTMSAYGTAPSYVKGGERVARRRGSRPEGSELIPRRGGFRFAAFLFLLVPVLVGCGAESDTSVTPGYESAAGPSASSLIAPSHPRSVWGVWTFRIPADHESIEIEPMRTGAGHVNVRHFLENPAFPGRLQISDVHPQPGGVLYFRLTVGHPFTSQVYTGFDVRGVFITDGETFFPEAGLTANLDDGIPPEHPRLLNPSGWTRMFNPTEFPEGSGELKVLKYTRGRFATDGPLTATLSPYLAFRIEEPRRYFPASSAETREVWIRLPDGPVEFGYAVDACWMPPLVQPVTDPVTDFPISANCSEPYQIWAAQGIGLTPQPGSSCGVTVRTLDWQDPSQVSQVTLEAPDLFTGVIAATFSTVQDETAIWAAEIPNSLGAGLGKYPCLVTAWDNDEDPELGPVRAYQVFTLNVTETGLPIGDVVFVPGGDFLMGCHEDEGMWCNPPVNKPQHVHHVDDFYITVFKIRISEYTAFMADGGYERPELWSEEGWEWQISYLDGAPRHWNENKYQGNAWPDYPVVVSYWEAEAFADWVGGRLPKEPEWEYVAGGSHYYLWPWGNEWGPVYLDCSPPECVGGDTGTPYPIDRFYPDDLSPMGVSGIAGNCSEWCIEYFDQDIYEEWAVHGYTAPSIGDPYPEARVSRGDVETCPIVDPEWFYIVGRTPRGPTVYQAFRVVFDP